MMKEKRLCPGCQAFFNYIEHPVHAYIDHSPGCWQIATEVYAREYSEPAYAQVHRLTFDAYTAQHLIAPREPRAVQSQTVHLVGLYLSLEKNTAPHEVRQVMQRLIQTYKYNFEWLTPSENPGAMTIFDVHKAQNADEHCLLVRQWAASVWDAWSEYHDHIAQLAEQFL